MTKTPRARLLILSKYDEVGASSRYRFHQFRPAFEAAGFACTFSPLFDAEYLRNRYNAGRGHPRDFARALWRRLTALRHARSYDLVLIEAELIPYLPGPVERLLRGSGLRYVVDYDDAIFHNYDLNRRTTIRQILGGKIDGVMRDAQAVVAGNTYLAQRAARAHARRIEVVPTVLDPSRYVQAETPRRDAQRPVIGWIGSPSTAPYLEAVAPALAQAVTRHGAEIALIGSGPIQLSDVPIRQIEWSAQDEAVHLATFDIGIMPLPDTPWARGKCGFKLLQYMAAGLPTIGSAVGANCEIVTSETGILASTPADWNAAFERLLTAPALRDTMGREGRVRLMKHYTIDVAAQQWIDLIDDLLSE